MTEVVLSAGLTSLGSDAFCSCNELEEICIPEGVETINDSFSGCVNLRLLVLPSSVTAIKTKFQGLSNLTMVVEPGSYAEEFAIQNAIPYQYAIDRGADLNDYAALEQKRQEEEAELAREKKMQQAVLAIKKKFGITGMVFDRICRFHFFFLS